MLPSIEYTNTLANGVVRYAKDSDNKIRKELDSKMKDMYYTEEPKTVITDVGNTYSDWLDIVGDGSYTEDYSKRKISFRMNGVVYQDIIPSRYSSDGKTWVYEIDGVTIAAASYMTYLSVPPEITDFSLVKITTTDEKIHKIPKKYYDSGAPFIIIVIALNDDGTCEIDRTWDEIKEEFSKNAQASHYIIICPMLVPCPLSVVICDRTESGGQITEIRFVGNYTDHSSRAGLLYNIQDFSAELKITSTKIIFNVTRGNSRLAYNFIRPLDKNSKGEIYSNYHLSSMLSSIKEDGLFNEMLARVYYNNEHYYFESRQISDDGIVNAYFFSTTANGIYRRLKVTPGETEDSDDIITIDKEIDLTSYVKKDELPTKVSSLENDSGYLTEHQSLEAYAKKTEIPTVPTTDSELSTTSTNPVQNKIVKAELDKKLESIPVDGTTIKLNDQGQLTLALTNANGVSF